MDMLMLFASMGAKTLQTVTFNSNTTWTAPVNLLASVVGHGQNGTASTTAPRSSNVMVVRYHTTGTGAGPGGSTWADAQAIADGALAEVNAASSGSFPTGVLDTYADGTETVVGRDTPFYATDDLAYLTYSGGFASSGAITSSGTATLHWIGIVSGVAGSDATGFGFTFAGGAADTTATTTTHNNVSVTSGASYTIVVPSGATIQISYYV